MIFSILFFDNFIVGEEGLNLEWFGWKHKKVLVKLQNVT